MAFHLPELCRNCGALPIVEIVASPDAASIYTLHCRCGIRWESKHLRDLAQAWAAGAEPDPEQLANWSGPGTDSSTPDIRR